MISNRLLAPSALLAATALAGCAAIGQGEQPPDGRSARPAYVPVRDAANAYLATHHIPPRRGMTGGVIVGPSDPWVPILHCPGHHGRGSVGGPGACGAWAVWLMTAPGRVVTVRCGDQSRNVPCTGTLAPPESGGEIYVPASLSLTSTSQIVVVSDDVLHVMVDEPGDIRAEAP